MSTTPLKRKGEPYTCAVCGRTAIRTAWNQKYCCDCAKKKYAEQQAGYRAERAAQRAATAAPTPPKPRGPRGAYDRKRLFNPPTFACTICGAEVVRRSAAQRYCESCRAEVRLRTCRRANRKYYHGQRDTQHGDHAAASVTLSAEGKSINRIAAEARAFGMSYGQYLGALTAGTIMWELRDRGRENWREILASITVK